MATSCVAKAVWSAQVPAAGPATDRVFCACGAHFLCQQVEKVRATMRRVSQIRWWYICERGRRGGDFVEVACIVL